jgi:hypothetical protein
MEAQTKLRNGNDTFKASAMTMIAPAKKIAHDKP